MTNSIDEWLIKETEREEVSKKHEKTSVSEKKQDHKRRILSKSYESIIDFDRQIKNKKKEQNTIIIGFAREKYMRNKQHTHTHTHTHTQTT